MSKNIAEFDLALGQAKSIHVQQVLEGFEIVLGFETRNKYRILDERLNLLAYAAEDRKGIAQFLLRQFLGHWRTFDIVIYDSSRQEILRAHFPFRWFLKTLILKDAQGKTLGHMDQRFAFFNKKFDMYNSQGRIESRIRSAWFKLWSFEFKFASRKQGMIQKKWGGILSEMFTDKDNYVMSFEPSVDLETKKLMMAMCLMVDIVYFEDNQKSKGLLDLVD